MKSVLLVILSFLFFLQSAIDVNSQIDITKYKEYLKQLENSTATDVNRLYPAGLFNLKAKITNSPKYYDSVNYWFNLTPYERKLIDKNGFMVSERLSYPSFASALDDIYTKDLPVFISTDMILHALHRSYDKILMYSEQNFIYTRLGEMLGKFYNFTATLESKYKNIPELKTMLMDYDVYFTVAKSLFSGYSNMPFYPENNAIVNKLLNSIKNEQMEEIPLFSELTKKIDFSQFKPRGHYTQYESLQKYFRTMIWLGRTELYLIPPKPEGTNPQLKTDVQRQIIDACLMLEAYDGTGADTSYKTIDSFIKAMIGESDNVQFHHLREVMTEAGVTIPGLLDTNNINKFQSVLAVKSYADQKILSQFLWDDPLGNEKIKPASAFMFMGQRFIIDSYIFSNLVHDKVPYRMLPSSLDILFCIGNNAAGILLTPEIEQYDYSKNILALRYLVDTYPADFWSNSFYNGWLNSIRTLNPPDEANRSKLPKFMQTAAWWQEKMNTQLASWAELRHDNLLYAKQSYSGGASCSYPYGYVEPFPEFYKNLSKLANNSLTIFEPFGNVDNDYIISFLDYFRRLDSISQILEKICINELTAAPITEDQKSFLKTTLISKIWQNCDGPHTLYDGWYPMLNYHMYSDETEKLKFQDNLIADVHTAPTDAGGNIVGWVLHAGTGNINLGVFNVENWDGEMTSFVGPVSSYYEYVTNDFYRMTDKEWGEKRDTIPAVRPSWVNLYLARKSQEDLTDKAISLPTGIEVMPDPIENVNLSVIPNPFKEHTYISLEMLTGKPLSDISVKIYDISGNQVKTLVNSTYPIRNFSFYWDGTDDNMIKAGSGTYIVKVNINGKEYSEKIVVVR